jgi:hypothetical protein
MPGISRHVGTTASRQGKTEMATADKFRTKAGRLTPYALACGYVERKSVDNVETTLWHEGGPVFHVRKHDFNVHSRIFWESFPKLSDARKCFDKA